MNCYFIWIFPRVCVIRLACACGGECCWRFLVSRRWVERGELMRLYSHCRGQSFPGHRFTALFIVRAAHEVSHHQIKYVFGISSKLKVRGQIVGCIYVPGKLCSGKICLFIWLFVSAMKYKIMHVRGFKYNIYSNRQALLSAQIFATRPWFQQPSAIKSRKTCRMIE